MAGSAAFEPVPPEEYAGPATILPVAGGGFEARSARASTTGQEIPVEVRLRGHVEPLDGRFHWYGRVAASPELAAAVEPGTTVTVTTPAGSAEGRLSDVDPWGRFRVSGTGRPPF